MCKLFKDWFSIQQPDKSSVILSPLNSSRNFSEFSDLTLPTIPRTYSRLFLCSTSGRDQRDTSHHLTFQRLMCSASFSGGSYGREQRRMTGQEQHPRLFLYSVSSSCSWQEDDSWAFERSQLSLQLSTATAWLDWEWWLDGWFWYSFDLDLDVMSSRSRQTLGDGSGCHRQLAALSEIVEAAAARENLLRSRQSPSVHPSGSLSQVVFPPKS